MNSITVQIRDRSSRKLICKQQISADSGTYQQDNLARRLINRYDLDPALIDVSVLKTVDQVSLCVRKVAGSFIR